MPVSHEPSATDIAEARLVISCVREAATGLTVSQIAEQTGLTPLRVLRALLTSRIKQYPVAVRPSPSGSVVELPE